VTEKRVFLLQGDYELTDVLRSFELSEGQLEFSFEELFKATTMRKTVSTIAGVLFSCVWHVCFLAGVLSAVGALSCVISSAVGCFQLRCAFICVVNCTFM
jgi:hypothetical protein